MIAQKARELAFNTVHTTYEEGLDEMMKYIDERIEKEASKGFLSASFCLGGLIKNFIKLSNKTIEDTVEEYIKTQYEKKFFKVYITRTNISPEKTLTIDW